MLIGEINKILIYIITISHNIQSINVRLVWIFYVCVFVFSFRMLQCSLVKKSTVFSSFTNFVGFCLFRESDCERQTAVKVAFCLFVCLDFPDA